MPSEPEGEDVEKDEMLKKMIESDDKLPDGAEIDSDKYPVFYKRMMQN